MFVFISFLWEIDYVFLDAHEVALHLLHDFTEENHIFNWLIKNANSIELQLEGFEEATARWFSFDFDYFLEKASKMLLDKYEIIGEENQQTFIKKLLFEKHTSELQKPVYLVSSETFSGFFATFQQKALFKWIIIRHFCPSSLLLKENLVVPIGSSYDIHILLRQAIIRLPKVYYEIFELLKHFNTQTCNSSIQFVGKKLYDEVTAISPNLFLCLAKEELRTLVFPILIVNGLNVEVEVSQLKSLISRNLKNYFARIVKYYEKNPISSLLLSELNKYHQELFKPSENFESKDAFEKLNRSYIEDIFGFTVSQ